MGSAKKPSSRTEKERGPSLDKALMCRTRGPKNWPRIFSTWCPFKTRQNKGTLKDTLVRCISQFGGRGTLAFSQKPGSTGAAYFVCISQSREVLSGPMPIGFLGFFLLDAGTFDGPLSEFAAWASHHPPLLLVVNKSSFQPP